MLLDGDGELVAQDVLLGFEVRGLYAEDVGEGGLVVCGQGGEVGVGGEELGEARGGEEGFGGDVDCGFGEAVGWGELHGEEEGEEELRFTGTAGVVSTRTFFYEGMHTSRQSPLPGIQPVCRRSAQHRAPHPKC